MLVQDLQTVTDFMFAGRAMITVVSKKTGERITYKLKKSKESDKYPVCYWITARIAHSFERIGRLNKNGHFSTTRDTADMETTPEFQGFKWLMKQLLEHKTMPTQAEIWHEDACGRCGRALSDPQSILTGIGPECRKKLTRFICV